MNSIGKLNLPGGWLAVVTLTVATTLPASVSDHFRSVASNVSGRAPLSASAQAELVQRGGVVYGGELDQTDLVRTGHGGIRQPDEHVGQRLRRREEVTKRVRRCAATLVVDGASDGGGGGAAIACGGTDYAQKCDSDQRNEPLAAVAHCDGISFKASSTELADARWTASSAPAWSTNISGMARADRRDHADVAVLPAQVGGPTLIAGRQRALRVRAPQLAVGELAGDRPSHPDQFALGASEVAARSDEAVEHRPCNVPASTAHSSAPAIAGDAMDVTPIAAPLIAAAAATPVTRVFKVTAVLSLARVKHKVNKCCWCVEFLHRTQWVNRR